MILPYYVLGMFVFLLIGLTNRDIEWRAIPYRIYVLLIVLYPMWLVLLILRQPLKDMALITREIFRME